MALASPPAAPAALSGLLTANPTLKPAITVSVTSGVRDLVMGKSIDARKAMVLGGGQYLYLMTLAPSMRAWLAKMTGENTYSQVLADGIGLSGILLVGKSAGLTSVAPDDQGGLVNPNLGNSMIGNFLEATVEGVELQIESQIMGYGLAKMGL